MNNISTNNDNKCSRTTAINNKSYQLYDSLILPDIGIME